MKVILPFSIRWALRIFAIGVPLLLLAIQVQFDVPTWNYLWTHHLWDPYLPFMLGFVILFFASFMPVPFGHKHEGGDTSK